MSDTESLAKKIEANAALDDCKDLRALIMATPTVRRLYFAAAVRCLGARRFYFDKAAGEMVFEPDGNAQMKAVAWLSAYDAGLPTQTTVNLNVGAERGPSLEEAAASSPELVRGLEAVLARVRKTPARIARPAKQVRQVEE